MSDETTATDQQVALPLGDDSPPPVEPQQPVDDVKAKLAAKVDKLEKEQKRRADEDRKRQDKKRIEEEGAKNLLKERDAELDSMRARIEKMEEIERERADGIFDKLSAESKSKIEDFRDKLSLEDWVVLVERELGAQPAAHQPAPPPTGGAMKKGKTDGYEPTQAALAMLEDNASISDGEAGPIEMLRTLQVSKNNEGKAVFSVGSVKDFFQRMNKSNPATLNKENALKRER